MKKNVLMISFIFPLSLYCMQETEFIGSEVPLLVKHAQDYLYGENGKEKNAFKAFGYFSRVIVDSKNITQYYAKFKVAELCYKGIEIGSEEKPYLLKDTSLAKELWTNIYDWAALEREKPKTIQPQQELYKMLALTIGNLARYTWEQKNKQTANVKFKLCLRMLKNVPQKTRNILECTSCCTYYLGEIAEAHGEIERALNKYKKLLNGHHVSDRWKEKAQHRIDNLYIKIFPSDDENIE